MTSACKIPINARKMKAKDLKAFEKKLLNMKEEIINKLQELRLQASQNQAHGVMDEIEMYHQDVSTGLAIELRERHRLTLLRIERALQKIQQKTYGYCESCGNPIEPQRLQAQPLARLCMTCMHDTDQNHQFH